MTEHPITPPLELVEQWHKEWLDSNYISPGGYIAVHAARWGADTELEACVEWITNTRAYGMTPGALRAARRPEPPSLKEQALEQLKGIEVCFRVSHGGDLITDTIRRALESLPE